MGLIKNTAPPHTQKNKRAAEADPRTTVDNGHRAFSAAPAPKDTLCYSHWNSPLLQLFPWILSAHSPQEGSWSTILSDTICKPTPPPNTCLGIKCCLPLAGCLFLYLQQTKCWSFSVLWVINGTSHSSGTPGVWGILFVFYLLAGVTTPWTWVSCTRRSIKRTHNKYTLKKKKERFRVRLREESPLCLYFYWAPHEIHPIAILWLSGCPLGILFLIHQHFKQMSANSVLRNKRNKWIFLSNKNRDYFPRSKTI